MRLVGTGRQQEEKIRLRFFVREFFKFVDLFDKFRENLSLIIIIYTQEWDLISFNDKF